MNKTFVKVRIVRKLSKRYYLFFLVVISPSADNRANYNYGEK